MKICCALLISALLALPAEAERRRIFYANGTGFFLTSAGDFITNAHVVQDCQPGTIHLTSTYNSPARLIAMDTQHDLALLRAEKGLPNVAKLAASERTINQGDTVMVIGFPQQQGKLHEYRVEFASVIDIKGPQGEPEWLQFSDSAQHGNSGGPLLDESGNVIGVVTGKTELYSIDHRTREQTLISQSDIAVTLPVLRAFLNRNRVRPQEASSLVRRTTRYVEAQARDFIAKVQCITGSERLP